MGDPASFVGQQLLGQVGNLLRFAHGKLRRSEFADVLAKAAADLRADAEVPAGVRDGLAALVSSLRTDPTVNRLVGRLLDDGDLSVVDELATHLAGQFSSVGGDVDPGWAASKSVAAIERALVAAKHTDRDASNLATRLSEGRTIDATNAGFADLGAQVAEVAESVEQVRRSLAVQSTPRMLSVDWAPDWPRKGLTLLGTEHPGLMERVQEELDLAQPGARAAALIADPPAWVRSGPAVLWAALTRFAEAEGLWEAAAAGWTHAAEAATDAKPVYLVRAAQASLVTGDRERHDALLAQATAIGPDEPRVRLQLAMEAPEKRRRELLGAVVPDNDEIAALVECHLALLDLMDEDLDGAERRVEAAKAVAPDLVQVRTAEANLAVQRNRSAIANGEPIDLQTTGRTRDSLLALRGDLLRMRRFEESGRLLMLAADSLTVSYEWDAAGKLLLTSTPEERDANDGGEILAEAALRAQQWYVAEALVDPDRSTPTARRVRARAQAAYGDLGMRRAAAEELDRLLADESSDREDRESAAWTRLFLCAAGREIEWSDKAEKLAAGTRMGAAALAIKAIWLTDSDRADEAIALLEPHLHETWAAEARYQVAIKTKASDAADWAHRALTTDPDQVLRFQCAMTLADTDPLRARAELATVARDRRAPRSLREEAFSQIVLLLLKTGEPVAALRELEAWESYAPGSDRASVARVTVSARQPPRDPDVP